MYAICQNKTFLVRKIVASFSLWNLFNCSLKREHMKKFVWYILKNETKPKVTIKVINFPYWFSFRDIQTLNMHSHKINLQKEIPNAGVKVVSVHWMWTEKNCYNIHKPMWHRKGDFFPPKQSTAFYNASNYRMYSYSISLVVVYDKIIRFCMNDILDLFEENKCLMAGKHAI